LIVDGRGNTRLAKRRPTLDWDEVAFPITVQIPPGWGEIYDDRGLNLTVPPPPEVQTPQVGQPETDHSQEQEESV
jgi:hypothetical protein